MSNEFQKEKHSKRLHQEETAIKKQQRIAKTYGGLTHEYESHRYSKHHAMNCGNPKCHMCGNPRKVFGEKTIQEQRFEQIDE